MVRIFNILIIILLFALFFYFLFFFYLKCYIFGKNEKIEQSIDNEYVCHNGFYTLEINRILLPDKEHRDYNLGFERETYYDASKNKLKILGFEVPIKTNLWDLTKVSEEFKNKNMTLK